jgi:hypothetical protein
VHVVGLAGEDFEGEAGKQVELVEEKLVRMSGFDSGSGERLDGEVPEVDLTSD